MDEIQSKKIFQPFTQGDSSTKRVFGGTGLGLVISRQLARAMGGDLVLRETKPQVGSIFVLTVKVKVASPAQRIAAPPAHAQHAMKAPDLSSKSILIVDDIEDNRTLIQHYLNPTKARFELVESGDLAIEATQRSDFDLILMDIQMPGLDGYETTRRIRSNGYRGPILALTAHASKREHELCLEAGCQKVLTKPVVRAQLFDALEAVFQMSPILSQ